jgi:DUF1365 family protein
LGVDRPSLLGLRTRDHGDRDGAPLLPAALDRLAHAGIRLRRPRVLLLAFPRLLGYGFNPVSFYYCLDDRALASVLCEVTNTLGERHHYVLRPDPGDATAPFRARHPKAFHVSPFLGMDAHYRFRLPLPGDRLTVGIRVHAGERPVMAAVQVGRRRELTDANLWRCFLRHAPMAFKVTGAIHFEALRLWLKGLRYRPPERPARPPEKRRDACP